MSPGTNQARPTPPARGARLVMASAFVGALVILALSATFSWRLGAEAHASPRSAAFNAPKGSCLDWKRPDTGDMRVVPCRKPHRFEVTGQVELTSEPDAQAPEKKQWKKIVDRRCVPTARRYLGGTLDPEGKYSVGALMPTAEQWASGERTLRCGLQAAVPSGALRRTTGTVRHSDQSAVYPPGTCLGIADKAATAPVPCDKTHSYEIIGIVDLGTKFDVGYPSTQQQQDALIDACRAEVRSYAPGVNLDHYKLTLTWDTRSKASWKAGSTRVNCKVGAPLPDGSGLKPVTGSIQR